MKSHLLVEVLFARIHFVVRFSLYSTKYPCTSGPDLGAFQRTLADSLVIWLISGFPGLLGTAESYLYIYRWETLQCQSLNFHFIGKNLVVSKKVHTCCTFVFWKFIYFLFKMKTLISLKHIFKPSSIIWSIFTKINAYLKLSTAIFFEFMYLVILR